MITYPYRDHGATVDSLFDRLQTRTASLDVKKGVTKKNRPTFITDIADKLQGIGAKYGYLRPMDFFGAEQKAFIYNLHTASNDKIGPFAVGDMNGNKQTQGAELILQGAHEYNARQLVGRTQPLFCFVQNISVNGFGDTMGYRGSRLSREATLMTEMAMMHTLRSTCTEDQQVDINQAMLLYVNYLGKDPREAYFSDSTEGKAAIQWMSIIKEQWTDPQSSNNTNISMSLMDCAKEHLKKIIGNNLHFSHQYAVLIQSLSVFVEKASIAGCKSGNERAQMINGRVGIFDQVLYSSDTADPAITDLKEALRNTDTDQLKKAMNDAYEKHGAQQAASMISEVDQGGPSKVNQRPKQGSINRNNVEEISMSQKYSDSLQAHKGMTKAMVFGARKAIATHQRDLLKNEKEQEFKKTTLKGDSKARKAFQEHLKSAEVLLKSKMSEVKRNQFIKEGKPEKAAINMKSLLGAKGVQLYKEALKEEREQEKASFEDNATDETLGEDHPFKKRFVAQILGPAGVGKTGAVRDLLPMLSAFMEKDTSLKKVKPTVLKIDGGDSRDHSKVRQWALQHAISKGYTGVKDIYSIGDEKILGKVKGEIEKRAAADSKCNMIIPTTTFKSNMVKKCNAPENVQEVFVHVMGEREVVAYQQNSRAWKKNWDNKALPESKAPPSSQAISFTSGEHQATLAMNAAQKKGALTFIVINDCILVKKINGEWKQTTDTTGEVRQVSKRAMEQWEQRDKKSDANVDLPEFLKNNNLERLPSIITTPEQLKVDATIKHLEKMSRKTTKNAGKENTETENTENDSNTLSEIVSLTKELQTLWEGKQWQEYQQRVYAVKYNITSACTHTTSHAIRTSLKQLESQLNEAQKRVPKMASLMNTVELTAPAQEGMPTPPVSPRGAAPSAGRDEAVDKVVFTREIVIRDPSVSKTSAQSPSGVSVGAKQVITQKEEVIHLEKNQYIQVSADFGGDQRGVLHQNSQGTVDDFSPDNLKPENEARLALEQAKLFLLHRKPGSGNIIMSGTNSTRANRVHAALLLLKNCDSSLEDIKIQSRVAHNASQAEPKDDEFLDKHLRNVIPSEVIERVKAEIRASIESKKSQAPVTPHSSQESLKVRLQQGRPNGDDSEATLVHKSPGVAPT
jgi:hypothetical protein